MAMEADGMADAMLAAMKSAYEGIGNGDAETKEYLKVFATGIIKYMQENAEILPGTFTNSGGDVTGIGKIR
jgi:hypothetical protein